MNAILDKFRKNGWFVKILTSRPAWAKKILKKDLRESGIKIGSEDAIFCDAEPKHTTFRNWLTSQGLSEENMQVIFVDDVLFHCNDLQRIQNVAKKVYSASFCYMRCYPNPKDLCPRDNERELVLVQLHAVKESQQEIPYEISAKRLRAAQAAFGVKSEMNNEILIQIIKNFLNLYWKSADGFPYPKI